jgi:hypothetical protein
MTFAGCRNKIKSGTHLDIKFRIEALEQTHDAEFQGAETNRQCTGWL